MAGIALGWTNSAGAVFSMSRVRDITSFPVELLEFVTSLRWSCFVCIGNRVVMGYAYHRLI